MTEEPTSGEVASGDAGAEPGHLVLQAGGGLLEVGLFAFGQGKIFQKDFRDQNFSKNMVSSI